MANQTDETQRTAVPYDRLVAQEHLILEATELIERLLHEADMSRADLARSLSRSRGWVTQVLSGKNLTLRTLADFAHALKYRIRLDAEARSYVDRRVAPEPEFGEACRRDQARPVPEQERHAQDLERHSSDADELGIAA